MYQSTIQERLSANDYLRDMKFDFEEGDLVLENGDFGTVEGIDAFIQKVVKFTLTEKDQFSYGLMNNIFQASDQAEFVAEAFDLANALVSQVLSDSKPDSLNGLGHTIEAVESIEKTTINEKDFLLITLRATGVDDALVIRVPYPWW